MKKQYISAALLSILGIVGFAPAFAQANQVNTNTGHGMHGHGRWGDNRGSGNGMMMHSNAVGAVTAINGTLLTLSGRLIASTTAPWGGKDTTGVSFTVDASNATIIKDRATSSLSHIAVGDVLSIIGTASGTNIVASKIYDGKMMGGRDGVMGKMMGRGFASSTIPEGNGQQTQRHGFFGGVGGFISHLFGF